MQFSATFRSDVPKPLANFDFLRTFLPRELALVRRAATVQGPRRRAMDREHHLGLFALQLPVPATADNGGGEPDFTELIAGIVECSVLDSDFPVAIDRNTFVVVCRHLSLEQSAVIAQQIVSLASRSEELAGIIGGISLGYVLYPLSPVPNLPVEDWPVLLEMARRLASAAREAPDGLRGLGLIPRYNGQEGPRIAESDLLRIALTDLPAVEREQLLRLVRVCTGGGGPHAGAERDAS
jgi:hypothetical protein